MYRLKTYWKLRCTPCQWRTVIILMLIMAGTAQVGQAAAFGELSLPPGSIQTLLGGRMRLFGMPVSIRVFAIPQTIAQAARTLGERYPSLSDMGLYPQRVVLSGLVANQLWVVNLEPDGPRSTRGSLSILDETDFSRGWAAQKNAADGQSGITRFLPWSTIEARLRLELEQDQYGRDLTQVWTSASSVEAVWSDIRRGLRQDRWQAELETPTASRWRRAQSLLQITITVIDGGTGIFLSRHDGAKS